MVTEAGSEAAAGLELESVTTAPPAGAGFVNVTVFDATGLPLSIEIRERFTAMLRATPTPLSGISCGAPETLSVIVRAPVSGPFAAALAVTLMVQTAPGASTAGHALCCVKLPPVAMPAIFITALPVLLSVRGRVTDEPMVTFPRFKLLVENVAAGACNSTETVLEDKAAAIRSRLPSPFRSPCTSATGSAATG